MKRQWTALWVGFVLALVGIEVGIVTRVIVFDPLTNFYFVILAVVVIGILGIIGAVFIGIFIAQRILSSGEFTPFEKEMLGMREDVKKLTAKVEEMSARLTSDSKDKI